MRTFEITRTDSGRFQLLSIFGYGNAKQAQTWDLSLDVEESKKMLRSIFASLRPEELRYADREPLIESISEKIPIPKKILNPTQPKRLNHPFIPQESLGETGPITHTYNLPGIIKI
jgi:hypothetical protein